MTTAENYFDKIYTMHLNEFVRMPKVYELMTDFARQYHKERLTLPDVSKSFTAKEVLNVLDSSYELIDAKSFFEDQK
jgi:hypothetical protein